jgi:signal transduction histidine kinase
MKFLKIILFFLLATQFSKAQDTTIVLSSSMLDGRNQISLENLNGWRFKQGNDISIEKINIDTNGWEKIKPWELSSKYADKNGRVKCWFRIAIQFDSSLLRKKVAFRFPVWAATELYMDGKLVDTRGNMGNNGKPYHEYLGEIDPFSLNLTKATPYIFVVHFVSYVSPIPPYDLEANMRFRVLGPNYFSTSVKLEKFYSNFIDLWVIVCAILSLLFWFLTFQNRQEKNLFWIALNTTVLTLALYIHPDSLYTFNSYLENSIFLLVSEFFLFSFVIVLIPVLLTKLFKRTMNSKILIVLITFLLLQILMSFLQNEKSLIAQITTVSCVIVSLIVCIYYIISSWKNLKSAQWSIAIGLGFSIFFAICYTTCLSIIKNFNSSLFSYIFFSGFILSFPLSLLVYVSLRFKEIINEVQLNVSKVVALSEEKKLHAENQQKILQEEVNKQTAELRQTLTDLKQTQAQLIQSEKMASLGELTAGIAHEIQNPLNFVNNFSEVNKELLVEMKDEMQKGNYDEAKEIIEDVIGNEEKINHHGKRADSIVKGMLQHSQTSTGQKEPTDINKLADEYLQLAYQGLRAKDKSFNATLKTDYDESIGNINIIPQDIGRVILNLINNAFYAVNEKKKSGIEGYEPTVSVNTKKVANKVLISVKDNGNGIPQKVVDKIFQPFFTTKPTGQGTGLGLSLSYDIVKAHGGELKVETREGEGAAFSIQLPTA